MGDCIGVYTEVGFLSWGAYLWGLYRRRFLSKGIPKVGFIGRVNGLYTVNVGREGSV